MRLTKGLVAAAISAALLVLPAGALAKRHNFDHDGMPTKWEIKNHLNPRANDARKDPDKDGLTNIAEFRDGTNPQKADTDGDGVGDGAEVEDDTNPLQQDSNHDGVDDGDEISGTVVSFTNGVLTIQLAAQGAGTVSGTVDDQTQIECDSEGAQQPATATASSDGSDDQASDGSDGDNSGPSTTSGAPQSGATDEQGCTSADLVPGARVHEAKLMTAADGSTVFTKIELVPAA